MRLSILLVVLVSVISASAQMIDSSEQALRRDILLGFGFCRGQQYGLERIKKQVPDLLLAIRQMELKFDSIFGKSCNFFETLLPEDVKRKVVEQASREIDAVALTTTSLKEFLERFEDRSNGKVESPYLETLLTWHPDFRDNPELEFSRGFIKKYSSKNHSKAKGLHLELNIPKSWKAREGNRPNIIQFFRAKNGFSNVSFSLMVKEATSPSEKPLTQREINAMFSAQGVREFGKSEGTLIESKPIVLEGLKGGFMVIDSDVERLEQKLSLRMAQYVLYYDNRYIYLQFINSGSGDPAKRIEWLRDFEKNRNLFQLVAGSLVIMDKY